MKFQVSWTAPLASVALLICAQPGSAEPGAARISQPAGASAIQLAQQAPAQKPAPGAAAAPAAPAAGTPPPWAVTCSDRVGGKLTCEMTQSVVEEKSRKQLFHIAIRNGSDGGPAVLLVRAFHGVYLPGGVTLTVDEGKPTPFAFQKSDQVGVYAALPLSEALTGDLKKGKQLKLAVQINKDQPLEIKLPLAGFPSAFDKVRSVK